MDAVDQTFMPLPVEEGEPGLDHGDGWRIGTHPIAGESFVAEGEGESETVGLKKNLPAQIPVIKDIVVVGGGTNEHHCASGDFEEIPECEDNDNGFGE